MLCGFLLQIISLLELTVSSGLMVLSVILNLIASYCVVLAADQCKNVFRNYNQATRCQFFLLVFFIPILGIIGSFLMMRWLYLSQKRVHKNLIHDVALSFPSRQMRNKYGIGGLRISLQSPTFSLANRVSALKTLSTMAPDKINNIVRTILPDTVDELRLLAFYVLNKQERKIIPEINKALILLQREQSPEEKAKLEHWLAFEYWELVYRHLIEPSLINFMLQRALHYANSALKYFTNDPSLWFLLGRIHYREREFDEAIEAFAKAVAYGAAKNRIVPYLAEVYFYQRNFPAIKSLISSQPAASITQVNKVVVDFWSDANER